LKEKFPLSLKVLLEDEEIKFLGHYLLKVDYHRLIKDWGVRMNKENLISLEELAFEKHWTANKVY
jgi:hypothetical protein